MAKILLVRHGETDWNRERRVLGWSQVPLNSNGVSQASGLASILPVFKIDAIYSSPLERTRQTAQILTSQLGIELSIEPRFTEANTGSWEGRLWKEFEDDPIRHQYYTHPTTARPPNGETFSEVKARAVSGVTDLLERHNHGTFLIVTHADLIRCILCYYLEVDIKVVRKIRIDHTSISLVSTENDTPIIHFLNWVAGQSRLAQL